MGAFAYSEEEGTYAAEHYEDDIPSEIKQERLAKLMKVQADIAAEINAEKFGKTMRVVIDREEGDYFIGRTEFDSPEVDGEVLIAMAQYPDLEIGAFYDVKIVNTDTFDLYGELV